MVNLTRIETCTSTKSIYLSKFLSRHIPTVSKFLSRHTPTVPKAQATRYKPEADPHDDSNAQISPQRGGRWASEGEGNRARPESAPLAGTVSSSAPGGEGGERPAFPPTSLPSQPRISPQLARGLSQETHGATKRSTANLPASQGRRSESRREAAGSRRPGLRPDGWCPAAVQTPRLCPRASPPPPAPLSASRRRSRG